MRGLAIVAILFALLSGIQDRWIPDEAWLRSPHPRNRPKDGFVTRRETAVAIGRAVLIERYGETFLKSEEPLDAKRLKDKWVVYGYKPVLDVGGTVNVLLSPKTGAVLNVFIEQ